MKHKGRILFNLISFLLTIDIVWLGLCYVMLWYGMLCFLLHLFILFICFFSSLPSSLPSFLSSFILFIYLFLWFFLLFFCFIYFLFFVLFIQCLCIIKSAPAWDRTMDLTVNSRSLCQLSHRSLYSSWSGFIYTLRDIVIKQWTEVMNNKLGWNIKG